MLITCYQLRRRSRTYKRPEFGIHFGCTMHNINFQDSVAVIYNLVLPESVIQNNGR